MCDWLDVYKRQLEFLSKIPAFDHDLGFLVLCSYGNGYRLTKNPAYKQVILDTADTLATLFNPVVGTILSWPREVEPVSYTHLDVYKRQITKAKNLEYIFSRRHDEVIAPIGKNITKACFANVSRHKQGPEPK